jgi:hypothetical protein
VIGVVLAGAFFLDSIVERGVETVGPQITKTDMKLDGVSLSALSGSGTLKGFTLGNPEGFKSASAMKVGQVEVGLKPMSVLADKVHVTHVRIIAPEITFEATGLNVRANNLSKILENVQGVASTTGSSTNTAPAPPAESGPAKKLQVDDFLLSGARVQVTSTSLPGQTYNVTIPDIHFTNLGTGPDGITAAELTKRVMDELVPAIIAAAQQVVGDLGKGATDLIKSGGENPGVTLNSVTNLFKKK